MKLLLFSLISFVPIGVLFCKPDFYWRDYDGVIPNDAMPGYSDGDFLTYIGNVGANNGGLYVGELTGGIVNISVYAADGANPGIFTKDTNIKILCTGHPESFEWVYVDYYTVEDMPLNSVVGGYTADGAHHLYIARPSQGRGAGNVYVYDHATFGYHVMYYVTGPSEYLILDRFIVLVYNDPLKQDKISITNQTNILNIQKDLP